ncbi:Endoribonuclease Dicer [Dissophora globulifera]|nr:Endoribonuclease Dicer [Dissophora globulifera]
MVGNGNIIIKALSEPGDRSYHDPLFWDSIRTSYDAVVTTTRTIHVWDKTSSRYGADQCFEKIIPWLVVDGFAKSRSACALDALVNTDKSWGSFLLRHLALNDGRINFESPLRCPLHTAAHVGRRFANLASSLHMIINFPNAQVADLTIRRSAEMRLQLVGAGTKRDSVAQVGNAFLQGGVESGLILAKSQFICLERIQTWGYLEAIFKRMRAQRLDTGSRVVVRDFAAVQTVEKLLGYVFVDKRLLLEALTHRDTPPNYERPKFLGDAVLGLVAAAYWARRYPKDQIKVTMSLVILSVCNATLGKLCLETGLYQHIRHATATNPHEAAFASVRVRMQDAKMNALDPDEAYWLQCKIPKVLADVMESVFGDGVLGLRMPFCTRV